MLKFLTDETNEKVQDEIEAMVFVLAKKLKKSKLVKIKFSGHYPFDMDVDTTMSVEELIDKIETVYYVRKNLIFCSH